MYLNNVYFFVFPSKKLAAGRRFYRDFVVITRNFSVCNLNSDFIRADLLTLIGCHVKLNVCDALANLACCPWYIADPG